MNGVHEPFDAPKVPPREPGEEITHWIERIAKANGWRVEDREPGSDG